MEVWKDIPDYEGYYQVSNYGNVRSLDRYVTSSRGTRIAKGVVLKPQDNGHGYQTIDLKMNNNRRMFYIHRLVANAFIDNPENKKQVNHKDFNRANNHVDNLEWTTCIENIRYSNANFKVEHKSWKQSGTGEKHIYFRKRKNKVWYRVCFMKKDRWFRSLEEAINYRESLRGGGLCG